MLNNQRECKKTIFNYSPSDKYHHVKWIASNLSGCALAAEKVWWTWQIENCFKEIAKGKSNAMIEFNNQQNEIISEMVRKIRSDLPSNERKKLNTSLVIEVHQRDVTSALIRNR